MATRWRSNSTTSPCRTKSLSSSSRPGRARSRTSRARRSGKRERWRATEASRMSTVANTMEGLSRGLSDLSTASKAIPDSSLRKQYRLDQIFRYATRGFAFLVLALLVGIIVLLILGSLPSIKAFGLRFLVTPHWNPVTEEFGALVPMVGTLVTSFIALLIGIPVSFGIALFLTELSPAWLRRPLGTAIELLAAIPSIIYGMWGLFVFAPIFQSHIQPALISALGGIPLVGALFGG